MGAMFIGQQFLQNVLGYSTVDAGLAILPAAVCMVVVAPRSAKLVEARGARFTLLFGYVFVLLGFLTMLLLWKESIAVLEGRARLRLRRDRRRPSRARRLAFAHGLGPGERVGMASGTADLQRDLGGAIMQSIFGALLTAGYASAAGTLVTSSGHNVTSSTEATLTKSFSSAADLATRYPPSVQNQIVAGAKTAFLQGDQWAYLAGIIAVVVGGAVVAVFFPRAEREQQLLQSYQRQDAAPAAEEASELTPPQVAPT